MTEKYSAVTPDAFQHCICWIEMNLQLYLAWLCRESSPIYRPAGCQCHTGWPWRVCEGKAPGERWTLAQVPGTSVSSPGSLTLALHPQGRVLRVRQQHQADQPGGRAPALPLPQAHQRGPGARAWRGWRRPRGKLDPAASAQLIFVCPRLFPSPWFCSR